MTKKKLIQFLSLILVFFMASSLNCGDNEIKGCDKCVIGSQSNINVIVVLSNELSINI